MNIRRICSLAVILSLLLGVFQKSVFADEEFFSDVPPEHQYYDAIEFLKVRDVISGYEDGTFRPEGTINRAEAMKIVVRGYDKWMNEEVDYTGVEEAGTTDEGTTDETNFEQPKPVFSDIADEWFAPYVLRAYEKGIVSGYSDGTFRPGNNINKAESLKIILLAFTMDETFAEPGKNPFPDVPFPAWYA